MELYRLLLHLFPASFRAEYGEEMCAVFAARRRRENALALWTAEIFGTAANATRVHFDLLRQDLRWTLRSLRQSPAFTLTATTVAALGIGATTAAFILLDHVLLRPLPYPDPQQLVTPCLTQYTKGYFCIQTSPPNFLDWRALSTSFQSMGAYTSISVNLSGDSQPSRLDGSAVDSAVFRTLGVEPMAGRGLTPADERLGAPNVVLLSEALASALFGRATDAVGRRLSLDNQVYTVIGVMPPGFAYPTRDAQLWTPLRFTPRDYAERDNLYLNVVARLRPGVSLEQARGEIELIGKQLERAYPKENAGVSATLVRMRDLISPRSRIIVLALFGAALCVLLIACTNLANLLFARALARRQEIAVRVAIGAARERLIRQLLTESLALALAGGLLGLALAAMVTPSLALLVPVNLPVPARPSIDWRAFAFAAALTAATSVAFGVGPALRSTRNADANALRSRATAGGRVDHLRAALVLIEVACTVTLLIGAGLLVKALRRVEAVDPGFRAESVLTLRTTLPMPKYQRAAPRREFYSRVLAEARALPNVTSAAYISFLPFTFRGGIWPVTRPGQQEETPVSIRYLTPDFFTTLRIPLLRGRDVTDRDDWNAPFVAVISESLARRLWPQQDPIGRKFNVAFFDRTVVGVVRDISVRSLEGSSEPQVYLPSDQVPNGGLIFYAPKDLVIRASDNPAALLPALRRIIQAADPEQAISGERLLEDIVASETGPRRTQLNVLGVFAAIAFLLAAIGIHGLLSYAVSSRTREVGVRVALGAQRRDILGMFLRQGLLLGAAGIAAAVPLAYMAARAMQALLFGVQPGDPAIYAAAAALALAMTIAGSLRPALHAAVIDPAATIRAE